jgi:uncharacterized protein YukE
LAQLCERRVGQLCAQRRAPVHIRRRSPAGARAFREAAAVLLPDPADLLAIAVRIAAHAAAVRVEADRLDASAAAVMWSGSAASAFDVVAAELTAGMRRAADRLDGAAAALRRHAYAVQDTLDSLRRLAGDGVWLGLAVGRGLLDEVANPSRLIGDMADVLGAAGHAMSDAGHLIGIG